MLTIWKRIEKQIQPACNLASTTYSFCICICFCCPALEKKLSNKSSRCALCSNNLLLLFCAQQSPPKLVARVRRVATEEWRDSGHTRNRWRKLDHPYLFSFLENRCLLVELGGIPAEAYHLQASCMNAWSHWIFIWQKVTGPSIPNCLFLNSQYLEDPGKSGSSWKFHRGWAKVGFSEAEETRYSVTVLQCYSVWLSHVTLQNLCVPSSFHTPCASCVSNLRSPLCQDGPASIYPHVRHIQSFTSLV